MENAAGFKENGGMLKEAKKIMVPFQFPRGTAAKDSGFSEFDKGIREDHGSMLML